MWFEIISSIVKLNQNFAELLRKKDCFTQGSLVNEPLSPEPIFLSSMIFHLNFVITDLFYFIFFLILMKGKMFQLVIEENRMVVAPKMTLIETFYKGTVY